MSGRGKNEGEGPEQERAEREAGSAAGVEGRPEPEGTMTLDDTAVADLVRRETLAVEGVTSLAGTFLDGWRAKRTQGVGVRRDEQGLTIELRVTVARGADCVRLFEEVRARVARKLRAIKDEPIRAIHMRVTDIKDPSPDGGLYADDPLIEF